MADINFSTTINMVTVTSSAACNITRNLSIGGWMVGGYLEEGWMQGGINIRTLTSDITVSVGSLNVNFIGDITHGELYEHTISMM